MARCLPNPHVQEMGILHYFVDPAPLMAAVVALLRPDSLALALIGPESFDRCYLVPPAHASPRAGDGHPALLCGPRASDGGCGGSPPARRPRTADPA